MSSGTPYIGSKISLVSKAEIRYEGFLYTIDQNDSTVTLAKVISLGTEDRVPGQGAVPAREEVFEYIVFRGSDIKDLHVCEGPKKVEDPAIVTHSYSQSYNPNYHRGPPFPGGGVPNFGYSPFNLPQPVDIPHSNSRQPTSPNLSRNDRLNQAKPQSSHSNTQDNGRNRVRGNDNNSRYRDDGFPRDNRDIGNNKTSRDKYRDDMREEKSGRDSRDNRSKENRDSRPRGSRGERESGERKDHRGSREFRDEESFENRDDSRENITDKRSRDNRDNRYRDRRDKEKENKSTRDTKNIKKDRDDERDEQQRSSSRGRGRAGRQNRRGVPRGGGSTRTKFTEDFDFESANAKFNKEEIEKELLKVLKKTKIKDDDESELKDVEEKEMDERAPLPSPDKFYDKSKSFFDNILCEAMVPKSEDEVMTRRQEQALNAETFGSSAAHYRPGFRGRGRGRGRWRGQGRGFYRGRGNFRGNSNRRWVDYEFDYEAAGIKSKHQPMTVSADD